MITLYLRDAQGIFCGEVQCDPLGALPASAVPEAPPEMQGTEVAQWDWAHWIVLPSRPDVVPMPITREAAKAARQAAVDAIRVTTSTGRTFDGDETSQTRMSRALIGMQAADIPAIVWTLADNTQADVSAAELTEALLLAGQEQARLWSLDQWGFTE